MAREEKLPRAGGGRLYYLTAATYEAIRRMLTRAELVPDPRQFETMERGGVRTFRFRGEQPEQVPGPGGGGGIADGAFFRTYVEDGDTFLQGGQVAGGTGNVTVADVKLYDGVTETWLGSAGQHLQLTVEGDGEAADGVLLPVFDVDSAAAPTAVASLGANTVPTKNATAGVCRISLGVFQADGFLPANAGNIGVGFCFGGFVINRF
jgi:hypothetical protein